MERHFHEKLEDFNKKILEMAAMAEEAIYKAAESLRQQDIDMAQSVIDNDCIIDEFENKIEEMAIGLLALQQPLASDLRFITTGMKINSELERISDLAVNIAKCVLFVKDQPPLKFLIDIPKLFDIARDMVKWAVNAFVYRDEKLAKQVILSDADADGLRNRIQEELVNEYMIKDKKSVPRAVSLFLVARHFERICDHATNIAEDVIYMVGAKMVKHHREKLNNGE